MRSQPWINAEVCREIDAELVDAFREELARGPAGTDCVIDKERYTFVRQELGTYYPDDLHGALPYVLLGFLRFGVCTIQDENDLTHVLRLLNVRREGYTGDAMRRTAEDVASAFSGRQARAIRIWLENTEAVMRGIAQTAEEAVSAFSSRQARAIRIWLEAVKAAEVFLPEWTASDDLGYAIAYWSERERATDKV